MEFTLFLYAMGIASLVLIPVLIYSGIDASGPVTWLLVISVTILIRRKIADRHLAEPRPRRINNAAIWWFILFLVLCEFGYYWQHPIDLHKAFDGLRDFQPPQ